VFKSFVRNSQQDCGKAPLSARRGAGGEAAFRKAVIKSPINSLMPKTNAIIFLSIAFLPIKGKAQAIEKEITDTTANLTEVVVTATRRETKLLSLPYQTNTVTRKEIDQYGYRTTPEALAGATGVFIQQTNHGGGSPFVRGLTGNQTLLLIDGIRFNNATFRFGPNQYLNTVDAYTLSKIEVARGTGSVQYGSDALGGVVQLFTKDPLFATKKTLHAAAIGKAATGNMEYTGRGELQYQSQKLAIMAGYTNRNFGDLIGGDTTGRQKPSGYKEQAFDAKLKWRVTVNAIVTLAHQYVQQKDVPLYHRVQLENFAYYFFAPQKRQMTYAKLDMDGNNKWMNKISLAASLQQSKEVRSYMRNGNAHRFLETDKVKTIGLTIDIASNITKKWTANSGIEYYHDKVNSLKQQITVANGNTINQRGLYPDDATSGNFSVYSLLHVKLRKFEVEAGLRYNSFTIKIPDTVTTILKLGDVTVKPSSLVANAAVVYRISTAQSIYGSFSTGYRTPNIDDLGTLGLVDFRWEIPAYNLKPEKTYNSEIGYKFMGREIRYSVSLFYMHLADLITRVQVPGQQVGGYNVYTKENSQTSYLRGFETTFEYQIWKSFSIRTGASYAYGQNMSRTEPMRRIPPFNGRVIANYQKGRWQAAVENLFAAKQGRLAQGDRDDNRIPKGGTPGWNILNLYGGYVADGYAFRLAIQNIFNQDYRTHGSGINGVGRSGSLSIQINL
jgi:hemoglobin/transferrin/lactoferrin receptor protein